MVSERKVGRVSIDKAAYYCRGCSKWTYGQVLPSTTFRLAGRYCGCGYPIETWGDAV